MSVLLTVSKGGVRRLTLNREAKRNALNHELCAALVEGLEAPGDERVLLLEAVGAVFSAGMDLEEAASDEVEALTDIHAQLFTVRERLTRPLVVAVEGAAYGGALGLVASGHYVVAAETASFALREIRLGLWPFAIYRVLCEAMGERVATGLSVTGRAFGAEEALRWGLVHEVVAPSQVRGRAWEVASGIAELDGEALERGLRFAQHSMGMPRQEQMAAALRVRSEAFRGREFRAAMERRKKD
jgi:methylglutaconyl-CoA hydratase